jgi:hypothetical protein
MSNQYSDFQNNTCSKDKLIHIKEDVDRSTDEMSEIDDFLLSSNIVYDSDSNLNLLISSFQSENTINNINNGNSIESIDNVSKTIVTRSSLNGKSVDEIYNYIMKSEENEDNKKNNTNKKKNNKTKMKKIDPHKSISEEKISSTNYYVFPGKVEYIENISNESTMTQLQGQNHCKKKKVNTNTKSNEPKDDVERFKSKLIDSSINANEVRKIKPNISKQW